MAFPKMILKDPVQALSMATRKDLDTIKAISKVKANKLLDVSGRKNPEKTGFRNGEIDFSHFYLKPSRILAR